MRFGWIAVIGILIAVGAVAAGVTFLAAPHNVTAPSSHPPPTIPVPEPDPIVVADIAWVFAPPPIPGDVDGSFVLQAGTLGEDQPILDLDVEWRVDVNADLTRVPAVGPPIHRSVVYVSDDGERSTVHRAEIDDDGVTEELGELEEVVWDLAVARDNAVAYAALTDRLTREEDLGVVRILLDGSGVIEPILPPADIPPGADIVLAAFVSFNVHLAISEDGRHLVRRACIGSHGCAMDILQLENGDRAQVADGELHGVAGGVMVVTRCGGVGCRTQAHDLETDAVVDIGDEWPLLVTSVAGRPLVLFASRDEQAPGSIDVLDVASGDRRPLVRTPVGTWLTVGSSTGVVLEIPDATVHVTQATQVPGGGAVVNMRNLELLVSLSDGQITEIPPAPVRLPPGFGLNG
jgi:hypothetical protein